MTTIAELAQQIEALQAQKAELEKQPAFALLLDALRLPLCEVAIHATLADGGHFRARTERALALGDELNCLLEDV
jgi:hypothetical protein